MSPSATLPVMAPMKAPAMCRWDSAITLVRPGGIRDRRNENKALHQFAPRSSRWLVALGALLIISIRTTTVIAQSSPLIVVQSTDGTLFLEQGSNAWTMVPNPISDAELAALTPSGELDGAIPGAPGAGTVLQVVQGNDGTLYIAQGGNLWTLVPTRMSDADLVNLTEVGEIDGQVSSQSLQPATPATASSPPTAQAPAPAPPSAPAPVPKVSASTTNGSRACLASPLASSLAAAPGVITIGVLDDATIAQEAQRHGSRWGIIYPDYAVGESTFNIGQAALQAHDRTLALNIPIPLGEANPLPYVSKVPTDGTIQVLLVTEHGDDLTHVMQALLQLGDNQRMTIIVCAATS